VPGDAYDFPKCLGLECENLVLANGDMIKNPHDPNMTVYIQKELDPNAYEDPNYHYYYPDSEPHEYEGQTQAQTVEDEAEAEDDIGSADDTGVEDEAGTVLCNDPNWDGEGTCIDPSTPKCDGNTDEICYTDNGELENVGCDDAGHRDRRNGEFSREVFGDNCGSMENAEDNSYYNGFIEGCMSVEGNTREVCESATDAGGSGSGSNSNSSNNEGSSDSDNDVDNDGRSEDDGELEDEVESEGLNEEGEWVNESGEEMCYANVDGSIGERVPC
jgi:hypothetical protein